MTRRERLQAIFEGRIPDRPAVKVWGARPGQDVPHPSFAPVRDLAIETSDLVLSAGSRFHMLCGRKLQEVTETRDLPTESSEWMDRVTLYHTPLGELREVFRQHTAGKPGYRIEHLLKEPDDICRLLSIPYEPYPFSADAYRKADDALGDAGIVMFGLDHAMYALQRCIGSENFALWSLEADSELMLAIETFAARLLRHAELALEAGIRGVFGWVGPELCIPPLMPPSAFMRYVFDIDRPLIQRLHEAGCRVWVHCHGRVRALLPRFVDMGVDVLNPVEPPPMGDVDLAEAFDAVGNRMALEGNVESHDFMTAHASAMRLQVQSALESGRGRRFILCPSSGYMENAEPTPREIENWMTYIREGVRHADAMTASSGGG